MAPDWSSHTDTSEAAVGAIQDALTVRLIMTERHRLMTCSPSDTVALLMESNVDQFSYIPVVSKGVICGHFNAERWFDKVPPGQALVEWDFDMLSEELIVGGDVNILDYLISANERPVRLVVSGSEIAGMVCLADLNKLPVRVALFGLITTLEMVMADAIQTTCGTDPEEWLNLLSSSRQQKVKYKIDSLQKEHTFVSEILATEFADKKEIVVKRRLLQGSKTEVKNKFEGIIKLRNSLAHASEFDSNKDDAERVPQTIQEILGIIDKLRCMCASLTVRASSRAAADSA